MNFVVTTHFEHTDPMFESLVYACDKESYNTEEELIEDIKLCLKNDKVAYIHYRDTSKDNYNQKLYTSKERFVRNTDYLTSYLV